MMLADYIQSDIIIIFTNDLDLPKAYWKKNAMDWKIISFAKSKPARSQDCR